MNFDENIVSFKTKNISFRSITNFKYLSILNSFVDYSLSEIIVNDALTTSGVIFNGNGKIKSFNTFVLDRISPLPPIQIYSQINVFAL
jgi:hypothetical protein